MKDLNHYKAKLLEERLVIIGDLKGVGIVKDKRSPDDWQATPSNLDIQESDSNEVADKIESYEENTDLVQKLEKQLTDVDAALDKISKNIFGICETCGEHIEDDRLGANPTARTCKKHMNSR